jgi:hypothetical protein
MANIGGLNISLTRLAQFFCCFYLFVSGGCILVEFGMDDSVCKFFISPWSHIVCGIVPFVLVYSGFCRDILKDYRAFSVSHGFLLSLCVSFL